MFVVGGESLIDLVAEPEAGDGLTRLVAHAGGSPYNCAIALARLGREAGFLCPISTDSFGSLLLQPLSEAGVGVLLSERVAAPTSLAVVTLDARRQASYAFYRSADRAFTRAGLINALPPAPDLFQIGGFCAILADDAETWLDVTDAAAARGAVISIDPNVRPSLVGDFAAYARRLDAFFDRAHIVKMSIEDLRALDPLLSPERHAAAFLARPQCRLFVVTLGEEGSRAFTASGTAEAGIWSPPVFGDTVGAGDCLMAGMLAWLGEHARLDPEQLSRLGDDDLAAMLRFAAVVAGLNCGRTGCVPPDRAEVEANLARS